MKQLQQQQQQRKRMVQLFIILSLRKTQYIVFSNACYNARI